MTELVPIDMDDLEDFDESDLDDEPLTSLATFLTDAVKRDPAAMPAYPPTLPVEVALRTAPPSELRAEYGLSIEQWDALKVNKMFLQDVQKAVEALKTDGMSFKMKAQLQAEELLKTSWRMIHDPTTPPPVKADLLKFTVRAAGLDGSKDQAANAGNVAAMQININLGGA